MAVTPRYYSVGGVGRGRELCISYVGYSEPVYQIQPVEEAEALLAQAGFVVVERYQDVAGKHIWLNFLALAV